MAVRCYVFVSLYFADAAVRNLKNSFMNSLGYIIDVFSGQATHVDTTTLQQVDVVLLCEMFYLLSWTEKMWTISIYSEEQLL
jgi:hypothetical protein